VRLNGLKVLAIIVATLMLVWAGRVPAASAQDADPSIAADDSVPAAPPETETFRLWSGRAPGAASDDAAETPTLRIVRPPEGWANGTAVIIAPGGAYANLAQAQEGSEPAAWFASRGVTAFVLTYRVGKAGRLPVPLLDGARAVRYVRAHAADFGIDAARIGMLGFSAGGHLAATIAAGASDGDAAGVDEIDKVDNRLDFLILAYPWVEGPKLNAKGQSDYCAYSKFLIGGPCDPRQYASFLPTEDVTGAMPPTFLFTTDEDAIVPAESVMRFYDALHANKVPAEIHIFEKGQHGSGMGGSNPALSQWPQLLQEWMRNRGLLPDPEPGDSRP
jgi:acetyl esterase/lipase